MQPSGDPWANRRLMRPSSRSIERGGRNIGILDRVWGGGWCAYSRRERASSLIFSHVRCYSDFAAVG